jgi:hypothetical protein
MTMTLFELRQAVESRIQVWHMVVLVLVVINVALFSYCKRRF